MGYCMEQVEDKFLIKAANKEAAFSALKDWAFAQMQKDDLSRRLGMSPIGKTTLLEDALYELAWEPDMDNDGNIIDIFFIGSNLRQEDEWMDVIAPYVEAGSQINMRGEDGIFWCWRFNGQNCIDCSGELTFPDMSDAAKDTIYTHDEAARIVEQFENVLARYDIKLPSPEDDERDEDNAAALYGSTYSELHDSIEATLIDLLNRASSGANIVQHVFSGKI